MKSSVLRLLACVLPVVFAGCATDYSWKPSVPAEMRSVSVPTFRNETDVAELGSIAARQVLREIQREGTFRVQSSDEAALEIQGVVKSAQSAAKAYDRTANLRLSAYDFTAAAEVSVIDRRTRKVLVDNRKYTAKAMFTANQDLATAQRDASGRLMEDLARQVVDDLLNLNWKQGSEK